MLSCRRGGGAVAGCLSGALSLLVAACTATAIPTEVAEPSRPAVHGPADLPEGFPAALVGEWAGVAEVVSARGRPPMEVAMGLTVAPIAGPTDSGPAWRFEIRYGEGEAAQVRRYRLLERDAAAGQYVIDEGGGALLDSWFDGAALRSAFEVQGTRLLSSWQRRGEDLELEILTTPATVDRRVGATEIGVLPVLSVQRGVLRRARG